MLRSFVLIAGFVLALGATQSLAQKDDPKTPKKDDAPKPPAGWKEHSPRDGTYAVWIPEKAKSQSERERTATVSGQKMKFNLLAVEMAGGPSYVVEEVIVPAAMMTKLKGGELADTFRDLVAAEVGGKVTEETDVKAGEVAGKEYKIESTKAAAKARVFISGNRVLMLRISGKKEVVDGEAGKTFLESGRILAEGAVAKTPQIYGERRGSEFKDTAPEGGLLVGFEIGLARDFDRDMTRAVRPIYRVGDKETMGEQRGTQLKNVVTVKAKAGYAVGGIAAKHGLGFDGMSVTFMKMTDGKLDPKDTYESEFVGSDEKKPATKIGGSGTPVIGIVGRTNDKDMTGMGLLLKGQEGYEPKKN